jgi:hypothetical protein
LLTDRPDTARWLSEEEKQLAVDRVKIERVEQDAVVDKLNSKRLKRGLLNPITLSTAAVFLLNNITAIGISFFLPTVIRTIYPGETVVHQQLRTVPPYIIGAVLLLVATYVSSRLDTRQVFLVIHAPLVLVGYAMLLATRNPEARYAALYLNASTIFIGGAISNAQVSANTNSDSSRSMAIATNSTYPFPQMW